MTRVACKIAEGFETGNAPQVRTFRSQAEKFPLSVLVVDDEPLIRWSITESLADLGYAVENAPDAVSALKIVTNAPVPVAVVILDLRLPDMHDLSLLGTLRQLLPDAQLILMTAFGTAEILADARAIGADVLLKPFELGDLTRLIVARQTDLS
jgi:DNA-binding NtrC family response regulator